MVAFFTKDDNRLTDKEKNEGEELNQPYEHYFIQRTYPDFSIDVDEFQRRIQKIRDTEMAKLTAKAEGGSNGFDVAWSLEGPTNIGGRINEVAVHPNNSQIIYAGLARGGVFKTTDGGANWFPIFDNQPFLSVGEITLDPSNPDIVYIGTGDENISISFNTGDGVWKSVDGGNNWQHLGLAEGKVVSTILVNPNNSNQIYVGCMGNPEVRDENRGLYRSNDGGTTWEKILYVDNDAGIIDIVMSPTDPQRLYAASWNRIRNLTESITQEQDSKIWRSSNGGNTWEELTVGLPGNYLSRIGLAISKQNPNKLYALYVSTNEDVENIYKTEDGGNTWFPTIEPGTLGNVLGNFGWYFGKIALHPNDDEQLYLLGVDGWRSYDGGGTWELFTPNWWTYEVHADKHDLTFIDDNSFLLATDGGLYRSDNEGFDWTDIDFIPNTQFYRIAVNPHMSGVYAGGAQDNGTTMGNANNMGNWPRIFGGDGFKPIFHPTDPDIFWVEMQSGNVSVTTDGGMEYMSFIDGIAEDDRRNWDTPYLLSKTNSFTTYYGTYRVYRNQNGAIPGWQIISPDLTDGNIYGDRFHSISTMDDSPLSDQILYVGTSDGNVWRTLDAGSTWDNITGNLPDRYVTSVLASSHQAGTVFVSISGYKGNGFEPHVFRSLNNGTTWQNINGNLPPIAVNDLLVLPEDTTDNTIFAATDAGVYATLNGGNSWQRIGSNMPFISVFDIDYDAPNKKLIAGTFARSILSFPLDSIINYESPSVSIQPAADNNAVSLSIYPNPASDYLAINMSHNGETNMPAPLMLTIYSTNGVLALQKQINTSSDLHNIYVGNLRKGMYLVQLTDAKNKYNSMKLLLK